MSKASKLLKNIESMSEKLSDQDQVKVLKDLKSWSGGFLPDEMDFDGEDGIYTYVKTSLPAEFNSSDVLAFFDDFSANPQKYKQKLSV